jgi:hypothetical protein
MLKVVRKVNNEMFYEIMVMKPVYFIRSQTIACSMNVMLRYSEGGGTIVT